MANASAKRIASQNERVIRNLQIGMLVVNLLSLILRFFIRKQSFSSFSSIILYALPIAPTIAVYRFLVNAGTPRRDSSGSLISPGDDLNQPGLLDWSWDVLYITWACQLGSGLLGSWIWYFYFIIPLYAGYKAWTSFISPILLGRTSGRNTEPDTSEVETTSKRQDKLRKRQEKGDPRVRAAPIRK
ncbi:hypothetical protein M422DRAFT_22690 [Sphaerobolus stellatus SS14]|nr:hypothetical protein M422DRAFT_22690 [Sphaerobolus stellatus SS14]